LFSIIKKGEHYVITSFSKIITLPAVKKEVKFIASSETYEKLKASYEKALHLLHNTASKKGIILIRYHNDADGLAGAFALKEALKKEYEIEPILIANKSPFYEYKDAIKDVNLLKKLANQSKKKSLLILVDLGSSGEEISMLKLQEEGIKTIIVDHHPLTINPSPFTTIINPHLVKGEEIPAGALTAELAYMISKLRITMSLIAAIAFYGDKIENELINQYLTQIKEKYSAEEVIKISKVVDVEAYLGNNNITSVLFKKDITLRKYEIIHQKEKAMLERFEKLKEIKGKDIKAYIIELEDILLPYDWPAYGKATGIINQYLKEKGESNYIILGFTANSVIIRINTEKLKLEDILQVVKQEFSAYAIDGGGHEKAGTIRFPSSIKEKVKRIIVEIIEK
ncbi:MAG: hypothetical protein GXN99_01070, partial [Candidatus Nanohaloarchaeota archaeon]|nr:hypothetical protein [Candidatus Nanohaloarchaeota archaeon]